MSLGNEIIINQFNHPLMKPAGWFVPPFFWQAGMNLDKEQCCRFLAKLVPSDCRMNESFTHIR